MSSSRRQHSADTRTRIIDAAFQLIVESGMSAATSRRIAGAAGLSLGTVSYHFASITDIVKAAFMSMVDEISAAFRARLEAATSFEDAREAVVDLICGDIWATPQHMLMSFELYALASRDPAFRTIQNIWARRSRRSLRLHFTYKEARALDALVEGLTIHSTLASRPFLRPQVRHLVMAITPRP